MRFTDPWYLLLLIPVVAGLLFSFRHVHGMAKPRKRLAFVLRFLLVSLIVFALSGPQSRRPNHGLCTIFLLDRSDSMTEADKKRADEFVDKVLSRLGPDDSGAVIAFGRDAVVDSAPGGRRSLGRVLSHVQGEATDVAGAVRLASASFPDGKAKRIVILSDGNETLGDAAGAAEVAAADNIPIDHVALGLNNETAEASVVDLQAPSEIRADQPFDVRVVVDSTVAQTGTLVLDRDGVVVKSIPVKLSPGQTPLLVSDKLDKAGFFRYRATLQVPHDRDNRNNVGMGFVVVRGKARVLVLQDDPSKSALTDTLRKQGTIVDLGGPGTIPVKPEDLQAYDAIIFNDINASAVTLPQMKLIQQAVQSSGIGFAMIGGENSFLPGGYYGTPIADLLPVDLNIRQRKSFPSTSILIMCDASGSMGMMEDGVQKIRLAAQAAEQTVRLLSPLDRVGVAGSTDGIEFVAPMQKLDNKEAVIAQVRKLSTGGGGIYIQPSMQKGEEVLNAETSKVRHFILMADGNDSDMQEGAIEIAERMKANKITTSVVAIGDGKDIRFLQALAAAGGGRYYLAKKASQLPAIFTQDAAVMSRSAIEEGAFYPKAVMGEPILRGIDSTPPLLAYCLTDSRALARTGMRTKKDDPLLATWQYGLGTSLAFTSDAKPRWAVQWVAWEGFAAFWSQAVRAITRRSTLNNYQVSVHQEGGRAVVEVRARDKFGNPMPSMNAQVRIAGPDGQSHELKLEQVAPGKFESAFDASALGSYIATLSEPDPAGGQRVSSTGFSRAYPAEYRGYRANTPLLERISKTSGGMGIKNPEQALRAVADPGASITDLWPLCIFLAALLLPLDIAVRRIALPLAEILAKLRARVRITRTTVPLAQQTTVGRLQQAKQRVHKDGGEEAPPSAGQPPTEKPRQDRPAATRATTGAGSAGAKLLDAKRKKRDGE